MTDTYILGEDRKTPIPVKLLDWALSFEDPNWRRVGLTMIENQRVSTVFLGLDHRFMSEGPPILWETMIFGPWWGHGEYQERYTSWEDAVAGHERAMRRAMWVEFLGPLHQLVMWWDNSWWLWGWRRKIRHVWEPRIAYYRLKLKGAIDAIRRS